MLATTRIRNVCTTVDARARRLMDAPSKPRRDAAAQCDVICRGRGLDRRGALHRPLPPSKTRQGETFMTDDFQAQAPSVRLHRLRAGTGICQHRREPAELSRRRRCRRAWHGGLATAGSAQRRAQPAGKPHRIDVHHHIVPPAQRKMNIERQGGKGGPAWSPQMSLDDMDKARRRLLAHLDPQSRPLVRQDRGILAAARPRVQRLRRQAAQRPSRTGSASSPRSRRSTSRAA